MTVGLISKCSLDLNPLRGAVFCTVSECHGIANSLQGEEAHKPIEDRSRVVMGDRVLDTLSFEAAGDVGEKGWWSEVKGGLNNPLKIVPVLRVIHMHRTFQRS